jgi:hypothetical protein
MESGAIFVVTQSLEVLEDWIVTCDHEGGLYLSRRLILQKGLPLLEP